MDSLLHTVEKLLRQVAEQEILKPSVILQISQILTTVSLIIRQNMTQTLMDYSTFILIMNGSHLQ